MKFSLYGFLLGLAAIVFWEIFERLLFSVSSDIKKASRKLTLGILFVAVPAIIGARVYHLATDWQLYVGLPWWHLFAIWQGGLGIFGALVGGILGLFLWKRVFHLPFTWWQILDAAAIAAPFGQAIGRWGNYVNNELFGLPTNLPWKIFIPALYRPIEYQAYAYFHPLFLYESLAMLLLGSFLFWVHRRFSGILPIGSRWYLGAYLFAYGCVRFCLDFLRIGTAHSWFGLTIAQWVSLFSIMLGLVFFVKSYRLQWLYEKKSPTDPEPASSAAPASKIRSHRPRPNRTKTV